MKKVSVIIPVYNLERDLTRCLDTVCAQSYANLQIILIDDGSKDGSLELCRKYAARDRRIEVYHHENHGVSSTRNRGIELASGDYIQFIDGDDYIEQDFIERYVEMIETEQADIAIGGIRMWDSGKSCDKVPANETLTRKTLFERICEDKEGLYGYVPNKLYRSTLIKDGGIRFREDMAAQEDLEFALSAYARADRIVLFNYVGYAYEWTAGKRKVPHEHIIANQVKLFGLAKANSLDSRYLELLAGKIRSLVYTALYWADDVETMSRLAEITMEYTNELFGKVYFGVLHLFVKGQYGVLCTCFGAWKRIKGKKTGR